jgi:predicted lipid-binding transport protein (Tim44 family)
MNKKTRAFVNSIVLISLALGSTAVEAKRFGGGSSFGSKSSYSAPMKRADLPPSSRVAPSPASRPAPAPNYQPQQQTNSQKWKDRAMGAAAGLAVGGLVGSMMGGSSEQPAAPQQNSEPVNNNQGYAQQQAAQPVQPQQYAQPTPQPVQPVQQGYAPAPQQQYAQPAAAPQYAPAPMPQQNQGYAQPMPYADNSGATKSSGFGFFGYLLLGGLGYLAYRFFFAKKNPATPTSQPNYQRTVNEPAYAAPAASGGSSASFNTDIMFEKGESTVSASKVNLAKSRDTAVPAGFDTAAFLDTVKHRYMDLQHAWDARDFAEIRGLATDKVFAEIQEQLKSSNETNNTEILNLDADLLEVRELSSQFEVAVLFDSIIREAANTQTNQVLEVWHFIKSKSGFNANWMLDGIQQLED